MDQPEVIDTLNVIVQLDVAEIGNFKPLKFSVSLPVEVPIPVSMIANYVEGGENSNPILTLAGVNWMYNLLTEASDLTHFVTEKHNTDVEETWTD